MKIFVILLCALSQSWAIPEANYSVSYDSEITPYFSSGEQIRITNPQGVELNSYSFRDPKNKKTLVILPGRTEPATKYAELIYDLKDQGFDIFILDHQGQGESGRRLRDSHKGYVRKFSHYVDDLKLWMNDVVLPASKESRFLLTHSMGGAIGAYYLSEAHDVFKRAILVAPMMQINTKPYTERTGRLLANTLTGVGLGTTYAPGRGRYTPAEDTFEKNEVTSCRVRFDMSKNLFLNSPGIVLGGPTTRWVREALRATKNIDNLAHKIQTPIILLQAQQDLIVELPRQNSFCEKAQACTLIPFPTARHEILMESDSLRDRALAIIQNTFSE